MNRNHFATACSVAIMLAVSACGSRQVRVIDAPPGTVLTVEQSATYSAFIADRDGRSVYLLVRDDAVESPCADACTEVWPPYLAPQGSPAAGDAEVQPALIGTVERADGSMQVTYGGHPLYYYSNDRGTGETSGQHVHDQWGEWYLVSPSGEPIELGGLGY